MGQENAERNKLIKQFQQKVINQSIINRLIYQKLADYLLDCCHAQTKPNTLSLFSFLPIFIVSFIAQGPSTSSFLLTIFAILIHQIFDIANKKQAYRLSKYSLSTFYIDHLFDSLSLAYLILTITKLLQMTPKSSLIAIFYFGFLPFYIHHLAMYNDDYLKFHKIEPTSQGLLLLKIIFFIAAIYPLFFNLQITQQIKVFHLFYMIFIIWLTVYISIDIFRIIKGVRITDNKSGLSQKFPLKNMFVIIMLGYIFLEVVSIKQAFLNDSVYFFFMFALLSLTFTHLICNIVLHYGYCQRYKQISIQFLTISGFLILFYALLAFVIQISEQSLLVGKIVCGLYLLGYFLFSFRNYSNLLKQLAQIIG